MLAGNFSRDLEFPYLTSSRGKLGSSVCSHGSAHSDFRGDWLWPGTRGPGGIHLLGARFGSWVSLHAAEITTTYLDQKSLQLSWCRSSEAPPVTLIIEDLDWLSLSGQAELLSFLEEEEANFGKYRLITTCAGRYLGEGLSG